MENILLTKNIDVSKVSFNENVRTLDNGGKTVYIGYEGRPLVFQIPEMTVPFGSSCWNAGGNGSDPTKDKHSVDLSFKGMESRSTLRAFHAFLTAFDDAILDSALENSSAWFKKKYTSKDVVGALYTPLLKRSKSKETGEYDDKYPPTFKINLPFKDGKYDLNIYNTEKQPITLSSIDKGSKVTAILQCSGLWIAGGKFGCSWKVIQLRVASPESIQGFAFQDDGDDNDVHQRALQNLALDDIEGQESFDGPSTYVQEPPSEVDVVPATELVESSDDEDDPIDKPVAPPPKKTVAKGKAKK